MDTKRKANGASGSESDDRSSKRRKVEEFDLSKGETSESTTAYGLNFLEQIRRTADKSGRLVAKYFEKLLPRDTNAAYYKAIRLPISLEMIEEKLDNREFDNLADLEGYFKRMVLNAKEFYPRSSSTFEDAERVRKALSNYMTKTNPAYSRRGYQALPTPLPPENGEEEDEGEEEEEEEAEDEGGNEDAHNDEPDEEAEEEEEEEAEDEGKDEDEEDEEDEDDDEDDEGNAKRKSIILKRRGPGRPPRRTSSYAQNSPKPSQPAARPDHQYENVPYQGLTFQQAQEKIVEEMLRHEEPDFENYFEPFVNLPPRALKDYYRIVTDPLSLKKLQKLVKGIHGRGDSGGNTDFKSWAAFEEKAKLLWDNAYYYNEEGSEIYDLAKDLEKAFLKQVKQAQSAVAEPAQPKIKLKVGQNSDTPSSSRRVTIHVGGRGGSVDSPAPQAPQVATSPATNGTARSPAPAHLQAPKPDSAGSAHAAAVSPSPSASATVKGEDAIRLPSVGLDRPLSATPGQVTPGLSRPPIPAVPSQPVQTNPFLNGTIEQKRLRRAGKGVTDALITRLRIQAHPGAQLEHPVMAQVNPHPKEMQQSATVSIPPTHVRVCVVPMIPDFLQDRQYNMWAMIDKQLLKPSQLPLPNQLPQERVFEVMLHPGINVIETHLVAAIPRNEREPEGPEVEVEVFTAYLNVLRT